MARNVRQRDVLKALRERHGGKLTTVGNSSITFRLLDSMGLTRNENFTLYRRLEEMHEGGIVVLEWANGVITSIALPELASTPTANESESDDVAAPKGMKAQPGRTHDDTVQPVATSYVSPESEEIAKKAAAEVAEAGSLILGEIGTIGHMALTASEVGHVVMGILGQLYDSAVSVQTMTWPVIEWLVDNGHMERSTGKETTYRLVEPEVKPDEDLSGRILRLIADMEEAQENEAKLHKENTRLRTELDGRISNDQLNKILDDLKKARESNQRLDTENGRIKLEQTRTTEAHKKALDTLRKQLEADHSKEIDALHKELDEIRRENKTLKQQAQKPAGLDEATAAKLRELGY